MPSSPYNTTSPSTDGPNNILNLIASYTNMVLLVDILPMLKHKKIWAVSETRSKTEMGYERPSLPKTTKRHVVVYGDRGSGTTMEDEG